MTGLVSDVMPRLDDINMQAVMTRWSGACLRRLDVSSLNYADVASLVASRVIGDGCVWSVLAMSCTMLTMWVYMSVQRLRRCVDYQVHHRPKSVLRCHK